MTRTGPTDAALTVTIISSDVTGAVLEDPSNNANTSGTITVTIAANATSAPFNVDAVDDHVFDRG